MDTQLHMNDDSMEWSSMGNNNEVVVTKVHQLIWIIFMSYSYDEVYYKLWQ